MNYEKKYKEALEKAKRLYEAGTITESLCHIFPELKESEGEKIRKLLIRLFTSNANEKFDDVSTQEIVAWLEKQGEKPQGKSALESWKDMRLEVYQQASGNRHEPNYSDDATKMFSLNDIDEIFEKITESSERNPAWNEEDEHRAKDTIYFLDTAKKHYASTVELDACIDWLKSLKDKVQPQSQQEWSEEDDNMLTDAIGAVGAADYYTFDDKQEIENWLKCLKQKIVG